MPVKGLTIKITNSFKTTFLLFGLAPWHILFILSFSIADKNASKQSLATREDGNVYTLQKLLCELKVCQKFKINVKKCLSVVKKYCN